MKMVDYGGLKSVSKAVNVVVDAADKAEQDDTCRTDGEGSTRATVALESGDGIVVGLDVHGLDNHQVVVERDDRVDQGNEDQEMETGLEGCHEDEELGEETCKRRDTCQ